MKTIKTMLSMCALSCAALAPLASAAASPPALESTEVVVSNELRPSAAATTSQRRIAGEFIQQMAKAIALMAHPTLVVDDYEVHIDGNRVVLIIEYEPSLFFGNRYTTKLSYGLDSSGLASAQITYDDTFTGAFAGLEVLKDFAADMLRDAREEKEEHDENVGAAARALELALSQNVSGNQIHWLVLRLVWASDDAVARYRNAA